MAGHASNRWSIPLGNWGGLPVRLHLSLLLVVSCVMIATAGADARAGGVLLAVVLVSSILHEAAHRAATMWLGGEKETVVLTPIGGLNLPKTPGDPEAQLLAAMVGPMANLAILVAATGALTFSRDSLVGLFTVAMPVGLLEGELSKVALKTAVWFNWLAFLLSLIPTYPFDGAPAMRAMLWPMFGKRSAAVLTAQIARALGIAIGVAAVGFLQVLPEHAITLSAPLAALSLIVISSSQYELSLTTEGGAFGGYLEDYASRAQQDTSSPDLDLSMFENEGVSDWQPPNYAQLLSEQEEDDAVDAILERLHLHGPQDLSEEDRKILQRASRRYRSRRGHISSD